MYIYIYMTFQLFYFYLANKKEGRYAQRLLALLGTGIFGPFLDRFHNAIVSLHIPVISFQQLFFLNIYLTMNPGCIANFLSNSLSNYKSFFFSSDGIFFEWLDDFFPFS
jgi:hypothetical protein